MFPPHFTNYLSKINMHLITHNKYTQLNIMSKYRKSRPSKYICVYIYIIIIIKFPSQHITYRKITSIIKVYTQTIITFHKSNNSVSKGQQIHSYLYFHNKYSKHNINQFKNNFISQYAICMKINIHSQKKDHRWSSGATSPGFTWSTKPK